MAGACFGVLFLCFFMCMWNGILLFVSPWCYAPYWSYPLSIILVAFKCCYGQTRRLGAGQGVIKPTSEVQMASTQMAAMGAMLAGGSVPAVGQAPNLSDEIAKLGELHKSGVLDYHEFQQAKARLLGTD